MNKTPRRTRRRDALSHASANHPDCSVMGITGYLDHDTRAPQRTWTPARVEERLRKAAAVMGGVSNSNPEVTPAWESVGTIGTIGGIAATADRDDAIAEAVEALSWLRWLDQVDGGIVIARLQSTPWKLICWRFGISRPTADRRWRYALAVIAWRLNENGTSCANPPSLRSMLSARPSAGSVRHRRARPRRALSIRVTSDLQRMRQ